MAGVKKQAATYPDWTPDPQRGVFDVLHGAARVSDNAVDCEGRQTHTRYALKHCSLHHHRPVILEGRDVSVLGHGRDHIRRHLGTRASGLHDSFGAGMEQPLVPTICFVSLVAHISYQVCP